jgi:hypothetical protein
MKSNDLRAMAPPAAKASYGFGWIAVQGAVCAAIAYGAYYAFSTPNLFGGATAEPKPSIAQQTVAVVQRVTTPAPAPVAPPPPPPPKAPVLTPAQEAAATVMSFLGRTSPTDPTFMACAKAGKTDTAKLYQKFVQGDHEAIARASDCYLSGGQKLCEPAARRDMLDVVSIYFSTKRAHIAAEKEQPGKPVVAAARWDTQLDRAVRTKFRNAMTNGTITPEEISRFRETEMQDLAKDLKPAKRVCGSTAAAASGAGAPEPTPEATTLGVPKPTAAPRTAPAKKKKD